MKIMSYTETKRWGQDDQRLSVKIGIHYGRAISGVIGHHKP